MSTQLIQSEEVVIDDELHLIENYDKLIKMAGPTYGPILLAAVVALFCITAVGIAWTWPVASSKVIVNVEIDAVELRLVDSWEWRQLPAKQSALRLEQLSSVEIPSQGRGSAAPTKLKGNPWIDLKNGRISINRLNIEQGALLRIYSAEDGFVYMHILDAGVNGLLSVQGDALDIEAGREREAPEIAYAINRSAPESLVFESEGSGTIPFVLRMRPEQPLVLAGIVIDGLSFARQVSENPGQTEFSCTISSGSLRFSDTEQDTTLEKGDCLTMHGEFGRVAELTIDDKINLKFEGRAKHIEIGPEGFQRNITPNYLEWLYHNQRLSFLWGVVAFLWGMLWSLRKVFAS